MFDIDVETFQVMLLISCSWGVRVGDSAGCLSMPFERPTSFENNRTRAYCVCCNSVGG